MSKILEQMKLRDKIIVENTNENVKYFDIMDYMELDKYSIYIFVTPRNIGKTYSTMKMIIDAYKATGEYSIWMRTSNEEIKEILKDYKANRPATWDDNMQLKGSQLIDTLTGQLIIKFVSVSTLGNLASIKGDGCFCIHYDEFLKRGERKSQSGLYRAIGDFLKTSERKTMLTLILSANLTTLDSEILNVWDLWIDEPIVDDEKRRLRWRYIQQWDNPPSISNFSTAEIWAKNDKQLYDFMFNAEVLDNSKVNVIPETRLGTFVNIENYKLNDKYYTLSQLHDNTLAIRERKEQDIPNDGIVYDLTTADGFTRGGNIHVRPLELTVFFNKIMNWLEAGILVFTTHRAKEDITVFLCALYGKIQREIK